MARFAAGTSILLTRPKASSASLAAMVTSAGARVWSEPMVVIEPVALTLDAQARAALEDMSTRVIFLSPNAVARSACLLESVDLRARVIAMGPGTASALRAAGHKPDLVPDAGTTSESLLEHAEFSDMRDRQVVVFQGEGGRELIQATLGQRGARVMALVCYRRVGPNISAQDFDATWRREQPNIIVVTSETALRHLLELAADNADVVKQADIAVISERLAMVARGCGWHGRIRVASSAGDESVVQALTQA